jgi:hypothetical protein
LIQLGMMYGGSARRLATLEPPNRERCIEQVSAELQTFDSDALTYTPDIIFLIARKS